MRLISLSLFIPVALILPRVALANTYYLDGSVATSGNGTSWASAWKNFSNITGLHAGDTVYISGAGNGQTYNTGQLSSASGTSGNPITYKVSTDAGRNGVVTINNSGGSQFIYGNPSQGAGQWITFDGNVNGARNLVIQGWSTPVYADGSVGITLRYVTVKGTLRFNGGSNIELDHMMVDLPSNSDRAVIGVGCGGAASYTTNKIHDSVFQIRYGNTSGFGDDGFGGMECSSFYNNQVLGVYDANYTWGQHQDGIQTGGRYNQIYNNYFYNMQNYPIYGDQLGGTLQHWRVYNNVFYAPNTSQGYQAVAIGCDGQSCTQDDIIVANNTIVSGANCIYINQGTPGTLTNTYVVNNVCYNAGSMKVSTATQSNNTTSSNGVTFVNPTSDWHLQTGSTAAIGDGISPSYLTSVYTTDKDGNQRTGAWDIGAYEYKGTTVNPPANLTAASK